MTFKVSPRVAEKLRNKHQVSGKEIAECFANRVGPYFSDTREDHQTDPPTYWFVAETDVGRVLKIVFVRYPDHFAVKTAFEPQDGSDALYTRLCQPRQ